MWRYENKPMSLRDYVALAIWFVVGFFLFEVSNHVAGVWRGIIAGLSMLLFVGLIIFLPYWFPRHFKRISNSKTAPGPDRHKPGAM